MIFLNLLIKPVAIFGIDATVQNRVGTEAYGLYFSLINLSLLFNIFLDLGINNFTIRNIAQNPKVLSNYWGKLLSLRMLLFFLYGIITMGVALVSDYSPQQIGMLAVLMVNQLLVAFIVFIRSHFSGLFLFKTDALISVLDRFLLIIIGGVFLFTEVVDQPFQIEWFIWIQTVCYAATLFLAFILLVAKSGLPKIKFSLPFSIVILRKSMPFAILVLLMMVYTRTDSVLLERIHPNGAREAGIYAQGFRLLDAFYMFGMIFANLLLPIFSKMLADKSKDLHDLFNSSRNLLISGSILIGFVCHFNAEWLITLIYKSHSPEAILVFQLLMWTFIAFCINFIYGTFLTASGDLKMLNYFSLGAVLFNLSLNFAFIPEYGAVGTALVALLTQSILAIVQAIWVHHKFKFSITIKVLANTVVFIICITLLSLAKAQIPYFIIVQIGVGLLLLFALKLIDLRSIVKAVFQKD